MSEKILSKAVLKKTNLKQTNMSGSDGIESIAGAGTRRKRYERAPTPAGLPALTPVKVQMLCYLAEMRFLSLPQIARLCCSSERENGKREDLSRKSARKHLRALFDAGLVSVLPVSRLALAPPSAANDASLLYGSAPNVYAPTTEAMQMLLRAGLIEREWAKRPPVAYGPKNSLFLAHELQVRDVRVWLEGCAAASDGQQKLLVWKDGQEAVIDLRDNVPCRVRPDAWFVYQVRPAQDKSGKPTVLVAFVEVDRGTERGEHHWGGKMKAYDALFTGDAVRAATGYMNARVLIITPNPQRQDYLAGFVAKSSDTLTSQFWLAEYSILSTFGIASMGWRQSKERGVKPLISSH